MREYEALDPQIFSALIRSFVDGNDPVSGADQDGGTDGGQSAFAQRLITGIAAENYFETVQPALPEFCKYDVENTTRLGCGYDFSLRNKATDEFLAVEVKGLRDKSGGIALTSKEYQMAGTLADKFYLFVVKNFRESPFHEIYQNPVSSPLAFQRKERVVVQISWQTNV